MFHSICFDSKDKVTFREKKQQQPNIGKNCKQWWSLHIAVILFFRSWLKHISEIKLGCFCGDYRFNHPSYLFGLCYYRQLLSLTTLHRCSNEFCRRAAKSGWLQTWSWSNNNSKSAWEWELWSSVQSSLQTFKLWSSCWVIERYPPDF